MTHDELKNTFQMIHNVLHGGITNIHQLVKGLSIQLSSENQK